MIIFEYFTAHIVNKANLRKRSLSQMKHKPYFASRSNDEIYTRYHSIESVIGPIIDATLSRCALLFICNIENYQ